MRTFGTWFFATLMLVAAGGALSAQPSSQGERYLVTLQAAAAVDRGDAVAAQLAATHGGSVLPTGASAEDTFVLRMSPSRVRVLAADPRVKSVVPLRSVTANAVVEPVNWTSGVSYTYDGSGSITKIGDDVVSDAFVYDDVGRLVQAKVNGATRDYVYDAFGNRTACLHNGNTDCQYDLSINSSNNRIDDATYDPAGTGSVTAFGPHAYTYDAVNMMTSDHSGSGNFDYVYTADDERIATYTANTGGWEWTVRDTSGKVLREFASTNAGPSLGTSSWHWTRDYVWRDGLLLASRQAGVEEPTTHHYHLDHLGSARRVTDDDDHIIGYHDYYAFGPEISGSLQEPFRTDLKFTGHEREPGNDQYTLDSMHARFYNPVLGRFLSRDPVLNIRRALGSPQLWNRYSYAANNPIKYIDPDGRELTISTQRTSSGLDVNVRLTVEISHRSGPSIDVAEAQREMQGAAEILGRTFTAPGHTPINVTMTIDTIITKKGGTDKSRHQMKIDPDVMVFSRHETELGGNDMTVSYFDAKWLAHEMAHWMGLDNEYDQDASSDDAYPGMETNLMNNDGGSQDMTHGQWLEILRAYREGEVNEGIKRKK